jgi:DNA invertase Pin-like site-specific DNA recombinase
MLLGYARVSKSEDQQTAPQIRALKPKITAEQRKEIVDAVSSGRKTAAQMARLFKIHRGTISRFISKSRADEKAASRP